MRKRNQGKGKVIIEIMTLKHRDLSHTEKEIIRNFHTGTVLSYMKLLELQICKRNKI